MGNVISIFNNSMEDLYNSYYPKNNWLQPKYLAPALMSAKIGYLLWTKQPIERTFQTNFIYLFSSSANLGMQLWKTFIAPTSLSVLPRHMHGLNQSNLFPKYFFLSTLFSFGSLASFLKMYPMDGWKEETQTLGALLMTSFVMNILNETYFGSNSVKYNLKMHEIERSLGEGINTVGNLPLSHQLEINPDYNKAKRNFSFFHGLCTATNMVSLGCTIGQFYLLARSLLGVVGLTYSIDAYFKQNPAV